LEPLIKQILTIGRFRHYYSEISARNFHYFR